jgi:hypothetical protein
MSTQQPPSLREALQPAALRAAFVPERPYFRNPWNKTTDMFACYFAIAVVGPMLLWLGGKMMGSIFDFTEHWKLGIYIAANVVGAAGFMTIVGRERTRLAVDVLAIAAWVLLGLVIAPVLGLDLSTGAAIACYAVLLVITLGYVLAVGQFEAGIRGFINTLTWPITWSLLAVLFAWAAYRLILYP